MKKFIYIFIVIFLLVSCSQQIQKKENIEKLTVYSTIYPYYQFAKEIGGDKVNVTSIMPVGADPHSFEPSAKTIAKISNCDVFIYNGLGIEPWVSGLVENLKNNEKPILLNASDFVEKIGHDNHFDPHIWLSLENVEKISAEILKTMVRADKKNEIFYKENYENMLKKINTLREKYFDKIKSLKNKDLITAHAAFGYLVKELNLKQLSISGIDSHDEPSAAHLVEIIKFIKDNNVKGIFLEPLTSKKLIKVVSDEAKVKVLTLNPLGAITKEQLDNKKDYFSIMEENYLAIIEGLSE